MPNKYHAFYSLGRTFEQLGQSDKAADMYRKVIRLYPLHETAPVKLNKILRQQGISSYLKEKA